jgi:quercetin dioxygenase-like cupin family protein
LKWIDDSGMKGVQQAVLWGDPAKGAFGALKKMPGGAVLPVHTHTNAMREVVVAGIITLTVGDTAAKDLGPQSYTLLPAGIKHTAACKPGADCIYFEVSTGAYDMKTDAGSR